MNIKSLYFITLATVCTTLILNDNKTPPNPNFSSSCSYLKCTFDGSPSLSQYQIKDYTWIWGDGKSESHSTSQASNTWNQSGTYLVTLVVTDSIGQKAIISKYISVTAAIIPPKIDTVVITIPPIHDTIKVTLPIVHDTVSISIHDTIQVGNQYILPPGVSIYDPNGERGIYFNGQYLGRLVVLQNGQVQAHRFCGPLNAMKLTFQGIYGTQILAIASLILPPAIGLCT